MAEPLLELRGLHAFYGTSHVLHGIDLRLERAQSLALLGRNGMGKTTLLRSVLGLVPRRQGEVRVHGRSVTALPAFEIAQRGIAYVPEGRGIFPGLTVRENLCMAARPGLDGQRRWTVERVLETFPRLAERRAHMGDQLSGGEQQMLAIGRALATNPDLLILDEATEGLAPVIGEKIWTLVGELRREGMGMIIVDKNYLALAEVTDLSLILVRGSVVFEGASSSLVRHGDVVEKHLALS
jgi:branched-chain amino acid transport system ATP-binding protein